MNDVVIYTDGACSGKTKIGGYAFIILKDGKEVISVRGGRKDTTNNAMELTAIVRALKQCLGLYRYSLKGIDIYSDSAYCVNSIEQGWFYFWKDNNWKTKTGENVKNSEIWKDLFDFMNKNKKIKIELKKVKAHSGNKYNEMVDSLAKQAIIDLNAKCITK